jgi:hypothetical protein
MYRPRGCFQELVSRVTLSLHCSKDADDRSNGFSPVRIFHFFFDFFSWHWNFADWTPVLGTHINYLLRLLFASGTFVHWTSEKPFSRVTAMGCRVLTAHIVAYVLNRLAFRGSSRHPMTCFALLAQTMQSTLLEHPYFWQPRELLASLWLLPISWTSDDSVFTGVVQLWAWSVIGMNVRRQSVRVIQVARSVKTLSRADTPVKLVRIRTVVKVISLETTPWISISFRASLLSTQWWLWAWLNRLPPLPTAYEHAVLQTGPSFLGYEKWNSFIMNDDVAVVCILPIDDCDMASRALESLLWE